MRMTREQLSELLSAYLDGEVDARERVLAEEALRADPAAQRLLEELRQTVSVIKSLPRHAAPAGLAVDIDAQLERAQLLSRTSEFAGPQDLRTTSRYVPLKAAAMLAIVLGAGWWFLSLQQERRPDGLRTATSSESKDDGNEPDTASIAAKPASTSLATERLLASGADPVMLVRNSFEPEPIRLRVVARDSKERDVLKKNFLTQLAQAKTENLAHRGASSGRQQSVGAFYLEGKPGVNFSNMDDRQVLVRMPQANVEQIVDDVVGGSRIPAEQLALQVGPAIVRGPDNARGMLQVMAEKDLPAPAKPPEAVAYADKNAAPPTGLLNTLGDMVGLGPVMNPRESVPEGDTAALASRERVVGERIAAAPGDPAEALKKESSFAETGLDASEESEGSSALEGKTHRTLVSKRLEAARIKRLEMADKSSVGTATVHDKPGPNAPATSPGVAATNEFITMVIEFVLPVAKSPTSNDASR